MTTLKLTLVGATFAVAFGGSAGAQPHTACKDEIAKFCANVPAGGGRIAQCLDGHVAELSTPCKTALAQMKDVARRSGARGANAWFVPCQPDVQKLCSDVKVGQGRVLKCLREHKSELSDACQEVLPEQAQ